MKGFDVTEMVVLLLDNVHLGLQILSCNAQHHVCRHV